MGTDPDRDLRLGYVGAGLFVAHPMHGFPPGAPAGFPANPSWHSWTHLISGSIGFIALIATCFVFARRIASLGQRAWTVYSVITGIVVLAAVAGISSGSQQAAIIIGFFLAAGAGWAWLTAISLRLLNESR